DGDIRFKRHAQTSRLERIQLSAALAGAFRKNHYRMAILQVAYALMDRFNGLPAVTPVHKYAIQKFHPLADDRDFFNFLFCDESNRLAQKTEHGQYIKQPLVIGYK